MPKMEQRASATRAEILARKQLVDLVAAADYLNCSVKTVRRRIAEARPRLPCRPPRNPRGPGRFRRIDAAHRRCGVSMDPRTKKPGR